MPAPFSPRLRLAPFWPAALALVVAGALILHFLPGNLAQEAATDLVAEARLLARGIELAAIPERAPDATLQHRVRELAADSDHRITLIRRDGTVLADSSRQKLEDVAAMESHRERPEIAAALDRGQGTAVRHSGTSGLDTAYAAVIARSADGQPLVVRVGRPLVALETARRHLTRTLLLSALAAALLVALLSWWLSRTLFRPLAELIAAADDLGRGHYDRPIEIPAAQELSTLARALERIAREARRQLAAVESERNHLRATVASMTEGVLVTDSAGRVRLVNPAFRALFGLDGATETAQVLDFARQPQVVDLIRHVLAGGRPDPAQLELPEPRRRRVLLHAARLAAGEGAVVVARDVTEAERLDQMRSDFVANVSHELKTPLAAIRGYAETLADGAVEDPLTAQRFSQRILDQCHRLGELLDDLLTLSRLEGTDPFRALEPVDLAAVVAEAVELVQATAAAHQVAIVRAEEPALTVAGDAEGLVRLVVNLLDNAIKYNRAGGLVTVRLAVRDGLAELTVEDTGIGIPASALPRLFERFYRVDKGRAREEGGTGLGLAIVKHVTQAHSGRVEVESEPGRGSTFRVLLPLRPPAPETRPGG